MTAGVWHGARLVARVDSAGGVWGRLRGLLGRDGIEPGRGLLLRGAIQVHTFGMRFPIDVVFCDRDGRVLFVERHMRPGRVTSLVPRARFALEVAAGGAAGLHPGDVVAIRSEARPDP